MSHRSPLGAALFQAKLDGLAQSLGDEAVRRGFSVPGEREGSVARRFEIAFSYFEPKLRQIHAWLYESAEHSNFTYSITSANKEYLAALCAVVLKQPVAVMRRYLAELDEDVALRRLIEAERPALGQRGMPLDPGFDFGRRLGWYVIARGLKPRVIVETGVAQGLGALVLTAALMRNAGEGHDGRYFGTDIDPRAGFLLQGPNRAFGTILYGDSIESLKKLPPPIDLFVNDSDHSADYERREYQVVAAKLSPHAIVLGDNSHATDALCEFARQAGRQFLFFQERPQDHWYPGAGIGISFVP